MKRQKELQKLVEEGGSAAASAAGGAAESKQQQEQENEEWQLQVLRELTIPNAPRDPELIRRDRERDVNAFQMDIDDARMMWTAIQMQEEWGDVREKGEKGEKIKPLVKAFLQDTLWADACAKHGGGQHQFTRNNTRCEFCSVQMWQLKQGTVEELHNQRKLPDDLLAHPRPQRSRRPFPASATASPSAAASPMCRRPRQ